MGKTDGSSLRNWGLSIKAPRLFPNYHSLGSYRNNYIYSLKIFLRGWRLSGWCGCLLPSWLWRGLLYLDLDRRMVGKRVLNDAYVSLRSRLNLIGSGLFQGFPDFSPHYVTLIIHIIDKVAGMETGVHSVT